MNLSKIQNYFYPHRILDIGANVGQFHTLCKNYFSDSYVFSIEASNDCEPYLKNITDQYYIGLLAKDNADYEFYSLKSNSINTGNSIYRELTELYSDYNLDVINKKGITFLFSLIYSLYFGGRACMKYIYRGTLIPESKKINYTNEN